MKKILLACPVSELKDYILPAWIERVKEIRKVYPVTVLLVDNSPGPAYFRKLKKLINAEVIHRPQRKNETLRETMAACNNIINHYLQGNGFDYLFSLECDIFPPADVLPRLLAHQKPVCSAVYNIGSTDQRKIMVQDFVSTNTFQIKILNYSTEQGFHLVNGQLQQVFACGLGCILIESSILKGYTFRTDPGFKVHADTFFHYDLFTREIPVYLDTDIFCPHINQNWNLINQKK